MPTALSPHNPRIERVRDLRKPQARRERGRFVLEGPTLLGEAHGSGLAVEELYGTETALAANAALTAALEAGGTAVFTLPERTLARLSDLETPPGLVAVAKTPAMDLETILARPGAVLLLAGIADPGNAGTLLRSAEAFGAAGVLFGRGSVDAFAPKVVRGAMGSLFRLPVATVAAEELLEAAAAAGRPIVAATLDGEPLAGATLPENAVLAVGNERHGVGRFLPRWDRAVRIEQASAIESLNAAVAGSILLYAMAVRKGQK
ncbi:MAG TPA: RNA methyltransferase [Candidatus Lustribacter sp.]|jgi:TrmH family RNA methyltransferase|nr:RNA methyltransferase [Candidatus Lustribacter sp.]